MCMQSLILSPLGLVTNSLLILVARDWGQAAAWLRAALGLAAIPELGKAAAAVLGSCGTVWVVPGPGAGWESSVSDFCSGASG